MKKPRKVLVVLLLLSLSIYSGCKFLEDAVVKVGEAIAIFDAGIQGNSSSLESILTSDFTFTGTEEAMVDETLNRSDFIAETTEDSVTWQFIASNISPSGTTATADFNYTLSTGDYSWTLSTELTLQDEGDFFASDWKVSNWHFESIEFGGGYGFSTSLRLHQLMK